MVGGESVGSRTVSDPLEHSGVSIHAEPLSVSLPRMHSDGVGNGGGGPRDHQGEDTLQDLRKEAKRAPPEEEEAIVVGDVGSAAPWFLTG